MTSATALPSRSLTLVAPPRGEKPASRAGAVVLSLLGSAGAFLIAGLGLLTVPIAALLAFGPVLRELL